jgi:transposase-like protein
LTQIALQGEMDSHLTENQLEEGGNRRNGLSKKMIKTSAGSFELESPRDRNGSFEPKLIKKRQTILNDELDSKF